MTSAMTPNCSAEMRSTTRAWSACEGSSRSVTSIVNGTSLLNLDGFAPASQWEELSVALPPSLDTEVA